MSCGCSMPLPGTVCEIPQKGISLPLPVVQRFAMCAACPRLSVAGTACTLDGKDVTEHARQGRCDGGFYPDRRGHIRWAGLVWIGVPMPIRWYLWVRFGTNTAELPGCGCVRWLKAVWRLHLRARPRYA